MPTILSRKELYDKVWSVPMHTLSKELGMSDVGLAKVCRRRGIPVPPRGYWAKKQAGKRVSQPPLPPRAQGQGDSIRFDDPASRPPAPSPPAPEPKPVHPSIAAESEPANAITVRDDLRITHPLLRSTREAWKLLAAATRQWDIPLPERIQVSLSRPVRPRALRILQALFTALERRGFAVAAHERKGVTVMVLDEKCVLTMRERQRQVRGERRRLGDKSLFAEKDAYALVDTGELELAVEGLYGRKAVASDGKNHRLEDHLNDVIIGLLEAALSEKAYRARQERERLAKVERERIRAEAKERARVQNARIAGLVKLTDAVRQHRELVAFRGDLREAVGDVGVDTELGRWLAWIDEHIGRLDVLKRFRDRQPHLTLYHCLSTYSLDGVLARGFENEGPTSDEDPELPKALSLTDVPMEGIYGGTVCIAIDAREDAVLPYESIGHGGEYRQFRVPADIANRFERHVFSTSRTS